MSARKGNWNCVEWHFHVNDAGQSNGYVELYLDGSTNPAGSIAGINVGDSHSLPTDAHMLSNLGGDIGQPYPWPSSNYAYFDDLGWSTARIGCK
jgi:hypothetical protein